MRRRFGFATPATPPGGAMALDAPEAGRGAGLRLFALTYAAGFLFVSLLIA